MISLSNIVVFVVLLWVCIYTVSYALWTWKKKNKLGAVMLFVLALAVLAVPVYSMFFHM